MSKSLGELWAEMFAEKARELYETTQEQKESLAAPTTNDSVLN